MTERTPAGPRYALFLCPDPEGAAHRAASEWLGRCAARDAVVAQPFVPGVSSALLSTVTEEPRRYGFHATLRAPFRAGHGVSRKAVAEEMASIAKSLGAFRLPPLAARVFGDILALVPEENAAQATTLAAECAMRIDRFRAPVTREEIRARASTGLTARQHALLLRWGHPFVMDEFRLHYALTGQLTAFGEEMAERLAAHASRHFRGVLDELRAIDRIALFEQREPGAPFRLADMAALAAPARIVYVVSKAGSEQALGWARERLAADARIVFAASVPRTPPPGRTVVVSGPPQALAAVRRRHPGVEVVHAGDDRPIERAGKALAAAIGGGDPLPGWLTSASGMDAAP